MSWAAWENGESESVSKLDPRTMTVEVAAETFRIDNTADVRGLELRAEAGKRAVVDLGGQMLGKVVAQTKYQLRRRYGVFVIDDIDGLLKLSVHQCAPGIVTRRGLTGMPR